MTDLVDSEMMVAFEVQTYQGGAWKIESMFDDRELAEMEAERLSESNRYSAVRLVEEVYDPKTQSSTSRTIFRTSRQKRESDLAAKREKQVAAEARAESQKNQTVIKRRRRGNQNKEQLKQSTDLLAATLLKGSCLLLFAIAVLYAVKAVLGRL